MMKRDFVAVFGLFLILSQSAWAVYNPQQGRFIQRDPVGAVSAAQVTPLINRGAAFRPIYHVPAPADELGC